MHPLRRVGFIISIHTPLAGRDFEGAPPLLFLTYFNPHAPRGARLVAGLMTIVFINISIHTPLAGRDIVRDIVVGLLGIISIHTPLAGRDRTPPKLGNP